jgi:hypothetical protein
MPIIGTIIEIVLCIGLIIILAKDIRELAKEMSE